MTMDEKAPVFRPRMGKRSRPKDGALRSFRSALMFAVMVSRRARARSGRSRVAVTVPGHDARRVTVKVLVARLRGGGAQAAARHLRYIQRDGVEKDGSPGALYDAAGRARAEAFEQPLPGERHQFRMIISPEDGGELELTDYIRRVMAHLERDLGRKVEWAGVNHHDTDNPHAHVVIRGVDLEGRELRIDRGYISNGLRWRAQQVATEGLGPRPEFEIRRAHEREVHQERFTSLDRELQRRLQDDQVLVRPTGRPGRIDESTLTARLEHLESMGLAERLSATEWAMRPGWQRTLRELAIRGDIIKQMHAAVAGDPARYHVVGRGQAIADGYGNLENKPMVGRVASKGLVDELRADIFVVLETANGTAYHVPVDPRSADALRTGDLVSFVSKPEPAVRRVDRRIAELAAGQAGVIALDSDTAAKEAARMSRRLRELERRGLSTMEAPGRWRVPADLVEQLQQQAQNRPVQHRVFVDVQPLSLEEQAGYRGPVWLDRVDTMAMASYGFGADVQRAVERRLETLRKLGIDAEDPKRLPKLAEIERLAVAKDVAAGQHLTWLRNPPDGFRGRARTIRVPSGASYTLVSDGASFVALREAAGSRQPDGKIVVIGRDTKGRPVVQPAPDRGLE